MLEVLAQLFLFSAKIFILTLFILIILVVFFALLAKSKEKHKGKLTIKNLNHKYDETTEMLLSETLSKKLFKKFLKNKKVQEKEKEKKNAAEEQNIFVLNFHGDIKASAVCNLREEITAILAIATAKDEVIVRLESGGGLVNAYGLAAAQLMRVRDKQIPLTVTIDKIAASGGYLMACIADKILSAPFAIIGSIGVIVQLPNFHRLLKEKKVDFEQLTAGAYKRTLTVFGHNTEEGREKLKEEIEDIHEQFKNLIAQNRQHLDINKVATGEHWLGQQALELKLVDEIKTSDEYIVECCNKAHVYEISYETKKPFLSKFSAAANIIKDKILKISYGLH